MANKEISKLSRKELLEIIIKQEKENALLRQQLEECRRELSRRRIAIQESGTMAEAALKLNKVFEAADQAVQQYLENVRGAASVENRATPIPEPLPVEEETEEKPRIRQPGKFLSKTRVR